MCTPYEIGLRIAHDSLSPDAVRLAEALGRLVSKPTPFCDEGDQAVCPYCDCTEHLEDCDWFLAQQVWVDIKNRAVQIALETPQL